MGTWVTKGSDPREDVQLMNMMRKVALALGAAVLGVGAIGIAAPAQAMDTNWPCNGCMTGHH
jgi:hypothetical protein